MRDQRQSSVLLGKWVKGKTNVKNKTNAQSTFIYRTQFYSFVSLIFLVKMNKLYYYFNTYATPKVRDILSYQTELVILANQQHNYYFVILKYRTRKR